jgi:hypothetical protein
LVSAAGKPFERWNTGVDDDERETPGVLRGAAL